jgi:putative tricarboxylic transport membrane protein
MKFGDAVSGLVIVILGIAVATYAMTFPPMPGQPVGPSLFPIVIGGAMAFFGAALMFTAARARTGSWIELDDWVRRPRMVFRFVLLVTDVVLYALVVDALGFFITAFAFLVVLFLAFGVTRKWIAPIAAAVTIGVHYAFYTLLRVPLPWGVLGGIAW